MTDDPITFAVRGDPEKILSLLERHVNALERLTETAEVIAAALVHVPKAVETLDAIATALAAQNVAEPPSTGSTIWVNWTAPVEPAPYCPPHLRNKIVQVKFANGYVSPEETPAEWHDWRQGKRNFTITGYRVVG